MTSSSVVITFVPHKMMRTADASITNSLNAAYETFTKTTEESVISYLDDVIEKFEEKEELNNCAKENNASTSLPCFNDLVVYFSTGNNNKKKSLILSSVTSATSADKKGMERNERAALFLGKNKPIEIDKSKLQSSGLRKIISQEQNISKQLNNPLLHLPAQAEPIQKSVFLPTHHQSNVKKSNGFSISRPSGQVNKKTPDISTVQNIKHSKGENNRKKNQLANGNLPGFDGFMMY